jgi:hypothetical protein
MRAARVALATGTLCICLGSLAADEPEYRATGQLRQSGFNRCASNMNALTKFIFDSDDFAYRVFWGPKDVDVSTAAVLASKSYPDAVAYSYIVSTPTAASQPACNQSFTEVLVSPKSCASVRENALKDWKYEVDLGSVPTYIDPTIS